MKYFLLGAFASSFLLYGIAAGVRRHRARTNLDRIAAARRRVAAASPLFLIGHRAA